MSVLPYASRARKALPLDLRHPLPVPIAGLSVLARRTPLPLAQLGSIGLPVEEAHHALAAGVERRQLRLVLNDQGTVYVVRRRPA